MCGSVRCHAASRGRLARGSAAGAAQRDPLQEPATAGLAGEACAPVFDWRSRELERT